MYLWWARRLLVASRTAVYGTLVPVPTDKKAADFVARLCTYPGPRDTIEQAQRHILQAHAERLTAERVGAGLTPTQVLVTVADIEAGRAPRPRGKVSAIYGGDLSTPALAMQVQVSPPSDSIPFERFHGNS